ncbi:MAG: hypothetical protein L0H26_07155, partial [Microlunatus sp.]|nr:hypothetical protein [Microlunatus sp.]
DWLVEDAARDRFPRFAAWVVFWVPIAGGMLLAIVFVVARPLFYLLQQEDQVVEWLQFALCLITAVLAGVAMWRVRKRPWLASGLGLLDWLVMVAGGIAVAPLLRFQEWVECALYLSLTAAVVAIVLRTDPPRSTLTLIRLAALAVALLSVVFAIVTPLSGVEPGNL